MGAWVSDLIAKGYDFRRDATTCSGRASDFKKPADRGFRFIPTEFPAADERDDLPHR